LEKNNVKHKIYDYDPLINSEEIIYLNETKTSYIKIGRLPEDLKTYTINNFDEMFSLHPLKRHKIIFYRKELEVHRWQQSYLQTPNHEMDILNKRSYMYSGFDMSKNNDQLPQLFQNYYDYMKSLDEKYNQIVVNWSWRWKWK
jgi:hypothetical protein